ncbi:MAG: hypothetical protein U0Q18_23130 [Bryobacteraceae bacterium]
MAGYLDQYGAGEEQREKLIKKVVITVVVLLVVSGVLYYLFKNYRQERQVRAFYELLAKHDYQGAYELWGCTEAHPCRDYQFSEFMKDWGPQSEHADIRSFHITKSRSCGSGVIITVDSSKNQEDKLWVQRDDLTIGFSPLPGCPPGR